ncbi:Protein REVEILLE 8 [Camellia lanceoleosa]|uniref:Protein REVEILLE 8 n=1 Tax=Camellia lanceoleosa TaxID=1840588 RepID=A0ACC0G7S4_9ERIC|nr:Protein REVEILLE 8 [Camellia lanceoleosa]
MLACLAYIRRKCRTIWLIYCTHLKKDVDWDAAVQLVVKVGDLWAQSLPTNDWYRLRRSLEIIKAILAPWQAFIAYPSLLNSLAPGCSPWADISMLIHSPSADIGSKGVARISNSGIDGIGSLSRTISSSELSKQGKPGSLFHGIPDFAEVYSFMGSVFDPDTQGRVQKLKEMDPINFEILTDIPEK